MAVRTTKYTTRQCRWTRKRCAGKQRTSYSAILQKIHGYFKLYGDDLAWRGDSRCGRDSVDVCGRSAHLHPFRLGGPLSTRQAALHRHGEALPQREDRLDNLCFALHEQCKRAYCSCSCVCVYIWGLLYLCFRSLLFCLTSNRQAIRPQQPRPSCCTRSQPTPSNSLRSTLSPPTFSTTSPTTSSLVPSLFFFSNKHSFPGSSRQWRAFLPHNRVRGSLRQSRRFSGEKKFIEWNQKCVFFSGHGSWVGFEWERNRGSARIARHFESFLRQAIHQAAIQLGRGVTVALH